MRSVGEEASERRRAREPPIPRVHFTLQPKPYTGPSADEVLLQRQVHLSAGQYHFYTKPLMLVEASMQYCFDDKGKEYVDCYSNVCHVGHCHPHFVNSCSSAMHNIISNTRYLHPTIVRYAEKLKSKMPPVLSVCYFVNSGSEANDLAMRLARIHTSRNGVIALEHAYHGTTGLCTGVSTSLSTGTTKGTRDYEYNARDVYVAPVPDPYRGKYLGTDPQCGHRYAHDLEKIIHTNKGKIAAFIHEAVQGVGGQIVFPKDYLKQVYAAVRKDGGICICDEVQTGFGRTGSHFWAFESQDVVPDILTLGKPIGNGFPLGAVLTTREIARSFDGVQYFNTNGGNPVACAAGLAVLEIIERDRLQQNARDVSHYLMGQLQLLKDRHALIGDVRGVGLFIGIELVRDRRTKEPAKEETAMVMERSRDLGLLVGKGGAFNNVIRLKPPLCFTREDGDFLISVLDRVIPDVVETCKQRGTTTGSTQTPAEVNTYINCASPESGVRHRTSRHYEDGDNEDASRVVLASRNSGSAQRVSRQIPRALASVVEESRTSLGGNRREQHIDSDSDNGHTTRRSSNQLKSSSQRRSTSFQDTRNHNIPSALSAVVNGQRETSNIRHIDALEESDTDHRHHRHSQNHSRASGIPSQLADVVDSTLHASPANFRTAGGGSGGRKRVRIAADSGSESDDRHFGQQSPFSLPH